MNFKKVLITVLITTLLGTSIGVASDMQCNYFVISTSSLINFLTPLKNNTQALACCGESKAKPGYFLAQNKSKYTFESCHKRYKNNFNATSSANFGFMECIGAGMSAAYNTLKDNIASIWSTITSPLEFLSDMSELGKMLIDPVGRNKLYQFIKSSIKNGMGNIAQCLSNDELEEQVCKLSGQFIANFVPPVLLVKAIVKSVKLGKATKELSDVINKTITQKKLTPAQQTILKTQNRRVFTAKEIAANAALSNRDRILVFEKLLGVPAGTYAKNPAKYNAIIAAHNLDGSIGKLTFAQIRARAELLSSKGFSSKEIRLGLDAGIFGQLERLPPLDRARVSNQLPQGIADLDKAKRISNIPSTKYDSGQSLYQGDNNAGIDILELNGKKIFSKNKYDPKVNAFSPEQVRLVQDSFVNESKFAKKLSDLGLGPKFYGSKIDKDGKYSIATEFVEGFEVHLGDTVKDIRNLKLGTIYEMKERALKAVENGIDPFDLQFRVSKDGTPFIIDPEYFSPLDPKKKAEVLESIEDDFKDLINQKKNAGK